MDNIGIWINDKTSDKTLKALWLVKWLIIHYCIINTRSLSLSLSPQPGGAAGQGPPDGLLPPLPRLLPAHHPAAGDQGHGGAGVGLHLPVLPIQVPVEADDPGHEQHLQVSRGSVLLRTNRRPTTRYTTLGLVAQMCPCQYEREPLIVCWKVYRNRCKHVFSCEKLKG